tara:strand:+ start:1580 stop:2086 length:507 start_codon:yes stop_codon:yes gene_type:complete
MSGIIECGQLTQTTNPIFHVTKSADQTGIADATPTLITFDEATDGSNGGRTINRGGLWASNKLTVTAATVGYYWIYASIYWETSANIDSQCYGFWKKNGSDEQQYAFTNKIKNTSGQLLNHQIINLSSSGDYVEFYMYFDVTGGGETSTVNQNSLTKQRTNVGGWRIS